jgi:short-subunit dehydrogenase
MVEGTWALVTGASAGIGLAFARQLAARGHGLVLVARSERKLTALAQELHDRHGVDTLVVVQDLAAAGAAEQVADAVAVAGIQVEVLVNNAGIGTFGRDAEIPADYNRDVAMVNVVAVADLVQRFLPGMVARGSGAVVNVASMAGFQPQPFMALYAATKAFVVNYSLGLWVETKGTGVKVLAVCPGPVNTDFPIANGIKYDEQRLGWLLADPEHIVRQSLRALDRDKGYVVPDWRNWPEAHLLPRRPRRLMARLIGLVLRRFADYQRRQRTAEER